MKKLKFPSLVVGISLIMTFGFSDRALSKSKSGLCRDLNQLKKTAGQVQKINGDSSIGELKEMQKDIFAALGQLGVSGGEIGKNQIDELRENARNIDRKMKDIDDDSTLKDVVGTIFSEILAIESLTNVLGSLSECDFK